jgi:transcriptional regulator with XRE-family HTH domain
MKTCAQYLDDVKRRLDLPSDYALQQSLGISKSAISLLRNGKTFFDDATALRIANILDIDPLEVVAAANAERARNSDVRHMWENVWGKAAGAMATTAFAACIVGLAAAPSPAQSAPLELDNGARVWIMSNRRRAANDAKILAA